MTDAALTPAEPISGIILAGGFGTRLGRDKAAAEVAGRPLLHWTAEALAPVSDDLVVVARACLPAATAMLEAGERRLRMLLDRLRGCALPTDDLRLHDPDLRSFTNVNRPADLQRVAAMLSSPMAVPHGTPGSTQRNSP